MKRFFALSLMLLLCAPGAFAQSADDLMVEQAVNQLISRKTITFVANRILTSGGNQSMLTQLNSMTVNKDSLTVSLPYISAKKDRAAIRAAIRCNSRLRILPTK